MHGDPLVAKRAAEQMLILEPDNVVAHVAISKTFADMSMWKDVETVWASMKKKRLVKEPGCSWINIKNEKHIFLSNDCRHRQKDLIDETLWTIYFGITKRPEGKVHDIKLVAILDTSIRRQCLHNNHNFIRMATCLLPISLVFLFSLLLSVSIAVPPASPVLCNSTTGACIVSNAYGVWGDRQVCSVPSVVYPTTEAELVAVVADASRHNLKLKVISGFSHSIPKLVCPSPTGSVLISTTKYAAGISVDPARRRVVADAGVGLRDLIDEVEAAGLSLPAAPYWEESASPGCSARARTAARGGVWAARCTKEGFAKVLDVDGGNPEVFNAVKVSLGLLGVISKVTLSLQPAFKRSITYDYRADDRFQDEFTELAKRHEFFDITWYPSQGKAVYRLDDREPINASGDGVNDFIGFQSNPTLTSMAVRATEKSLEESKNVKGKCAMASTVLAAKALVSNGLKNNNVIFTGYPVVGRQSRMQTSGSCLHSSARNPFSMCAWDSRIRGLFFYETTAMFSASKFRDFVLDVKKLRDLSPQRFCGVDIYTGFPIRFVKASDAYLGQPEDCVVVDFNYYRADDP
ncbi:hypothetical protein HPP92_008144 [Vanilla planifolia]|uniref:FAD-binding PCMH-type domain-containing protein n=1 Tax=Vanilla planifolia TaxID=51239 RepID=A0A835RND5_VANPL|nr:hypothetical protein HPP92_008144 [Vanilla planifolia]